MRCHPGRAFPPTAAGYTRNVSTLIHHPIRTIELEARHLRDVEKAGESPEALLIALGGMAVLLWALAFILIGLAFGAALLFG